MKNENAEPTIQEVLAENRLLKLHNARLSATYSQLKDLVLKFIQDVKNMGLL